MCVCVWCVFHVLRTSTGCESARLFKRKSLLRHSYSVRLKTVTRCACLCKMCVHSVRVCVQRLVSVVRTQTVNSHGHSAHTHTLLPATLTQTPNSKSTHAKHEIHTQSHTPNSTLPRVIVAQARLVYHVWPLCDFVFATSLPCTLCDTGRLNLPFEASCLRKVCNLLRQS